MTHALKTWPQYMDALLSGAKTFELRKDDRPFDVEDTLLLQEYSPTRGYTGEEVKKIVTYILRDAPGFGLKEGYCIIGIKDFTTLD
jgi:hypothetical protein